MTETEAIFEAAGKLLQQLGEEVQRRADVVFPGWRERLEALEAAGYQGNRCGWYPAKPKRQRGRRHSVTLS